MSKKSVIYLSTALSDGIYEEIVGSCRKFKPTFSGVGFDRNVALGLSAHVNVHGISRYPIPSWPKYNKIIQKSSYYKIDRFVCQVPRMVDLPVIKESSYFNQCISLASESSYISKDTVIVLSGLYRSLLRPATYLKHKYGLKICAIVPDLPELMITYRKDYSKIRRILNRIDVNKTKKYFDTVDGFVFLSKYMNDVVNNHNKPYLVVDGLTDISAFPLKKANNERFILYAGKVSSTFGVDKLVQGFIKSKCGDDIYLHICGDGDYADSLKKIADENDRIIFHGSVSHEEVLQLEVDATLLVEPRPSDTEIVKMSFPSKIIEYMASGTPVLCTNLPCFSEEYKQYQYRIDDESVDGIAECLTCILQLPPKELDDLGDNAKSFIVENKSIDAQCKAIISFIERL